MDVRFGLVRVLPIFGDEGVEVSAVSAIRGIRSVLASEGELLALFGAVIETHHSEARLFAGIVASFVNACTSFFIL